MKAIPHLCLHLCFCLSLCAEADAAPPLVLNTPFNAPLTSARHDGQLDLLYASLFHRLGLQVQIQYIAAERGLLNSNSGVDDGEVARIAGIERLYPNLIRVPEAVMSYQMVVFSRGLHLAITGPASLEPYDVGIVLGWKSLERAVTGTRSLTKVGNGEQLFNMLAMGRIDLAVFERQQGLNLIRRMGLKGIAVADAPLIAGEQYMFLNKKHAALVPRLTAELRAMKRDGSFQRILDDVQRREQE
ncbi:ABC transporter substrate-binding protein [Rugamonas sp.]|uniref:substrate-binding periplasmic protein n=1 Tax=Rugamonas sp. TaxID=1926287 RepID=UPI0025FE4C70|nr:transporter substrate-binding domain-containing protein [Rugamonas sp.]